MTKVVDKRKLPIYIDSELDDLGLDPYTFRIYARLARRAAGNGESYESVANMALSCHMSERQVKRALKLLVDCRIIARTSRPGETSIYQLNDRTCWEVGSPQARPWASTNLGRCEPGSPQARVPGSPQAHKGTPIEGEVIKEPPYIPPSGGTVKAESGFRVEENFEPEEVSEPATATQTPPPSKTSGQTLKAKRSAAATRRAKKAIKAAATNPQHNPTQFEAWWMIFRG
ncbi:MAG TPA: helix-turn-helix domain-containing protein, partial [Stenomitos sp.]